MRNHSISGERESQASFLSIGDGNWGVRIHDVLRGIVRLIHFSLFCSDESSSATFDLVHSLLWHVLNSGSAGATLSLSAESRDGSITSESNDETSAYTNSTASAISCTNLSTGGSSQLLPSQLHGLILLPDGTEFTHTTWSAYVITCKKSSGHTVG
jgi:hypothetical protein